MTAQPPQQQPAESVAGAPEQQPPEPRGPEHAEHDPGQRTGHDAGPNHGTAQAGERDRPDAAEFEDRWRRALADADNLRKRYRRELSRELAEERERVARAFLPVLDNVELALRHAGADPGSIVEGVRAIHEQALSVLSQLGYPRQDEAGVPFDPARHEVVAVVPPEGDTAPGRVVEVLRPGYGAADRQLRPASVTVAGAPES
ncbi:MAG: molecular chaperone GrpE [Pseudonocardiales bacterium]|jgi:molecular chaperone GrpE|nr:molecular chaperone GrpE [Pseudonocardiales bacterium]